MIRTFIALELKEQETIKKINTFIMRLKKNQPKLKIVEPKNLHLTIKFLGDIKESIAPKIYKILQEEINENLFQDETKEYTLKGAGQFNKFSVIWIGMKGDLEFLQKIKDTIEKQLNFKLKIEKDRRTQFKPHLTIGRLKKNNINYNNFDVFKKLINESKNLDFGAFKIKGIILKKSELTPKGPIYSDLIFND